MKTALIGFTGFVGSNLKRQYKFDDLYNSDNIKSIKNKKYNLVVCAGARAEKWKINLNPTEDIKNIKTLTDSLKRAKIKKLVLISTIDVYPNPNNVDEESNFNPEESTPYGYHRWKLEQFCLKNFNSTIIRLPGLFGEGIKKNAIYDFLNNNQLEKINSSSVYQFYYLKNLWKDISKVLKTNIKIINFATPPISIKEMTKRSFNINFDNQIKDSKPACYNFETKYDKVFKRKDGYIYSKAKILRDLKTFVKNYKRPLNLSISNIAWSKDEEPQIAKLLKENEVKYVEIAPTAVWKYPTKISKKEALKYKEFWLQNNIKIVAFQSLLYGHPELQIFQSPQNRQKTINYLSKLIKLASMLDINILVFGSPKNRVKGNLSKTKATRIAIKFFKEIAKIAEENNVIFCIEPNSKEYGCDFMVNSGDTLKIIKSVDSPFLALNLDAACMTLTKENTNKAIKNSSGKFSHFHISEAMLEPIGKGTVKHHVFGKALKNVGYQGIVSIEMKRVNKKDPQPTILKAIRLARKYYS